LEEAGKCSKTWSELERLAGNRIGWTCFFTVFLMDKKDILLLLLLLLPPPPDRENCQQHITA
jgi:hypothetical protein